MLSALTFPRFHHLKDQEYFLFNSNHLVLLSLVFAYPNELLDTDQSMYLISLYSTMLIYSTKFDHNVAHVIPRFELKDLEEEINGVRGFPIICFSWNRNIFFVN